MKFAFPSLFSQRSTLAGGGGAGGGAGRGLDPARGARRARRPRLRMTPRHHDPAIATG